MGGSTCRNLRIIPHWDWCIKKAARKDSGDLTSSDTVEEHSRMKTFASRCKPEFSLFFMLVRLVIHGRCSFSLYPDKPAVVLVHLHLRMDRAMVAMSLSNFVHFYYVFIDDCGFFFFCLLRGVEFWVVFENLKSEIRDEDVALVIKPVPPWEQ